MMDLIDWRLFNGDRLNHSGLNDSELDALHQLFKEGLIDGSEVTYSKFLQYAADNTVLVGSHYQEIAAISTFSYQPGSIDVNTIVVEETYRRRGLGSTILGKIIGQAKYLGCDTVTLQAKKSTLPFYEKHGFVRNQGVETEHPVVPMYLKLSRAALSTENTLRTPLETV